MLFCVKLWDVESAGDRIKPLIGPDTAVIPLQNGIDARRAADPDLGRERRDGRRGADLGLDHRARRDHAGRHLHAHDFRRARRQAQPAGEDFLALCQKAGFDATLSEQILTELWMKFILLATNASIMALARQPIGELRDDPDMRPVFIAAYQEVIDVGRARGVALPADALEQILEFTSHLPPAMKASMALDLERGNRLGAALARRQGRRTGPPARHADADARHDVCDAEAVRDGYAGVRKGVGWGNKFWRGGLL